MELAQAEAAAKAARAEGVGHVIWSTLEDPGSTSATTSASPRWTGVTRCRSFDVKAEADELFDKYDVPTTFLRTAGYFEGFASAWRRFATRTASWC